MVSLEKVKFSRAELPAAPLYGVVGEPNRQSNPRQESITDIVFLEARVLVAGVSNEEFSSAFRAIPFPFKKGQPYQTIEGWTGVEQLDRLDAMPAVALRRGEGGPLNLASLPLP